jgi:hypothetical protein
MQYQSKGFVGFLIQYGTEAAKHPYSQIPLEVGAKAMRDFPYCAVVCK